MGIAPLDWAVVALYFAVVAAIAVWAVARERRGGPETADGYFLAGRNVGWFVVGASLFASNIGSEHLVGLAGSGASTGMVFGQLELQASLILLLLGWLFVPFYVRAGVFTMPEFLERRYDARSRWYLSVVSILGYVLTKISVTIYAGAVVFETLMGIDFWTGALVVVVVTGLYTVFGGLRAVIYTDLMQAVVLIVGSLSVTVLGLNALGGWGEMTRIAGPEFFELWKPMSDPDFPWTGMAFGAPIIGVWYWCTDQFIVQRTLSARGIDDARRGTIMAGYLKQLPLFLFVVPGIVAYCLSQTGQLDLASADAALPTLVQALLPVGLRGLVIAGLLAALMSSLSSVFNSCSTLITWDVYKVLRPEASERRLVFVGRLATVALTVLGVVWIPVMSTISGTLYGYIQSVQAYISPPIAAVFLLGIFWGRLNGTGALAALLVGFVLGMGRLAAEVGKGSLDPGSALFWYADVNFLHMAILLFLISTAVLVVVSLFTAAPSEDKVAGLTWATARQSVTAVDRPVEAALPGARVAPGAAVEDAGPGSVLGAPRDAPDLADSNPSWRRLDVALSVVLVILVAVVMVIWA